MLLGNSDLQGGPRDTFYAGSKLTWRNWQTHTTQDRMG